MKISTWIVAGIILQWAHVSVARAQQHPIQQHQGFGWKFSEGRRLTQFKVLNVLDGTRVTGELKIKRAAEKSEDDLNLPFNVSGVVFPYKEGQKRYFYTLTGYGDDDDGNHWVVVASGNLHIERMGSEQVTMHVKLGAIAADGKSIRHPPCDEEPEEEILNPEP